ncbi:peptide ABC transporter substrate-binding protein [Turicibacter sp. T129]|uniref:peptide ABC transporter substrate-binding protein n=1 Tax=Turicibacter sp. T129 TaxID=2951141 RepID=UPI0021D4B5D9|nr:peptide ABC transporter substrate-binding protein [Turicibacter sp. T129]MCU7193661.1 peptide ABC transporter substrate-binding protein [Turicibacter sp. T129]
MKRYAKFLMIFVFSVVTLTACSGDSESSGKVLKVAKDVELASMDQHIATDGLSFEVIAATIEGLYTLDADGNAIPAIAKSYDVSEDGLVYTFHLREDAKWSNGEPVTANDFVYAWRRLVDPNTASEYAFIMDVAGVVNAASVNAGEASLEELGVNAVDDYTLEVTLALPVPFFLQLMTFPSFFPMNEAFVTEKGADYAQTPEGLLANGPFKMTEWTQGHSFKVEKNDSYYDKDNVNIDGIEYKIMKDAQTAALEFESGNLDVVRLTGEIVDLYKENEAFTLIHEGYLWYIAPNEEVEELQNVNLRQALGRAVNKEQLTETVLNDGSTVANFIVPVTLATGPDGKDFRETSANDYMTYDVEVAQEYWEKAKAELGIETLTLELLFEDTDSMKKCAEFIQSELQTNLPGLTIELKSQPKKNRLELMRAGDYQLGITRWGPDYADPTTYLDMFITGSSNNYPNYSNEEYDALMNRIGKGDLVYDIEARWEAMKEAEELLIARDAAALPMYQQGNTYLIDQQVKGIETHSVGVPFIYKNVTIEE